MRAHGNQVIGFVRGQAEALHQGRSRAAAFFKFHAEGVPQGIAVFRRRLQFVAHQAGVGLHRGHGCGHVVQALAEIVPVHLLGDAAQLVQFLAGRARLGGQLAHGLLVVVAQLQKVLAARHGGGRQRGHGSGGGFQRHLQRAACNLAHAAHGVAQRGVLFLRVVGCRAFVGHGGGGLIGARFQPIRCVGAVVQSAFHAVQLALRVPDLAARLVHGGLRAVQGNLQVVHLLAVFAVVLFGLFQLLTDELDLLGLYLIDGLQAGGF